MNLIQQNQVVTVPSQVHALQGICLVHYFVSWYVPQVCASTFTKNAVELYTICMHFITGVSSC